MSECDEHMYILRKLKCTGHGSLVKRAANCREVWELMHSGFYKDIDMRVKREFERVSRDYAHHCENESVRGYQSDRIEILRGLSTSQSEGACSGLNVNTHADTASNSHSIFWDTKAVVQGVCSRNIEQLTRESSLEEFVHAVTREKPFIVRAGCSNWCALSKWRYPQFWTDALGTRYVPVEVGGYLSHSFFQAIVTIQDLVRYIGSAKSADDASVYLAQYDIFERFPRLLHDINPAPDIVHAVGSLGSRCLFLGPAGTISPLHTDPFANVLCQIVGAKYVRMHDPMDPSFLHQNSSEGDHGKLPDDLLDISDEELLIKFPSYSRAHRYECTISSGDLLFIPRGWWHYVKSLSVACSIAHFIETAAQV